MANLKTTTFNLTSKPGKVVKNLLRKFLRKKSSSQQIYQLTEEELQNLENELREA